MPFELVRRRIAMSTTFSVEDLRAQLGEGEEKIEEKKMEGEEEVGEEDGEKEEQ